MHLITGFLKSRRFPAEIGLMDGKDSFCIKFSIFYNNPISKCKPNNLELCKFR